MKFHSLCCCIALTLFSFYTFAGDKEVEGWYQQFNSSKKIKASFLVPVPLLASEPNYEKMQSAIVLSVGGSKYSLTPEEVFEVSFTYKDKTILMRSIIDQFSSDGAPAIFVNVVVDGPVNLYTYYVKEIGHNSTPPAVTHGVPIPQTQTYYYTAEKLVLQRDGEQLLRPRALHYVEDLCAYFSDCPKLVDKIKSGTMTDLEMIAKEYNSTCADKTKPQEKSDRLRAVPANLERQPSDSDGF